MTVTVFPVDAVSGAPSYTGRQLRQLLAVLTGGGVGSRPLIGRSGVNPRTPASTVAASSSTWTVHPHGGYVDAEASAASGGYFYTVDADVTGSMTAANASNPRVDLIYVQISDPAESDGSSTPSAVLGYVAGTAAASPVAPATPARSLALAQINVPVSGGGSPSVSWVARSMTAAGGIPPVSGSSAYPSSPYVGQYIDDASLGLLRWDGAAWSRPVPQPAWVNLPIPGSSTAGVAVPRYQFDPSTGKVTLRGILNAAAGTYPSNGASFLVYNASWPAAITPGDQSRYLSVATGNSASTATARLQIGVDRMVNLLATGAPAFISLDACEYYL